MARTYEGRPLPRPDEEVVDQGLGFDLGTVTGDVSSGYTVSLVVGVDTTTTAGGGGPGTLRSPAGHE